MSKTEGIHLLHLLQFASYPFPLVQAIPKIFRPETRDHLNHQFYITPDVDPCLQPFSLDDCNDLPTGILAPLFQYPMAAKMTFPNGKSNDTSFLETFNWILLLSGLRSKLLLCFLRPYCTDPSYHVRTQPCCNLQFCENIMLSITSGPLIKMPLHSCQLQIHDCCHSLSQS